MRSLLALSCGLATSVLTAFLVAALERASGISIHTFSIRLVPLGALWTGAAAASGFYMGSVVLHARPTRAALVQTLAIGALTWFLIHYLSFASAHAADGARLADRIGFGEYLQAVLTRGRYVTFFRPPDEAGEVGGFGYVLASAQLAAFLAAGVIAHFALKRRPACTGCDAYLRTLGRRDAAFADPAEAAAYRERLATLASDPHALAAVVSASHDCADVEGAIQVGMRLIGCPRCRGQRILETIHACDGAGWKELPEHARTLALAAGSDLRPAFRAGG